METIPTLSAHDLREHLANAYGRDRNHHLFAVYGTGEPAQVAVPDRASVQVVPVRSELELRAKLPALTDDDARVVYLVPWTHDLPIDIAGRFALRGRVQRIGKEARLRQLFGAVAVDADAARSVLTDYLLRPGQGDRYPIADSVLTEPAMWAAWLKQDWGLDTEGGLALDTLLGWAATDGRGPKFVEAMQAPAAAEVRAGLMRQFDGLGPTAGPAARSAWEAWEGGVADAVVQLAVLFEVLSKSHKAVAKMWIRDRVRDDLGCDPEGPLEAIADTLGRQAGGALRSIERRTEAAVARRIVREAGARVKDAELRAELSPSARLPVAWAMRLDRLGEALLEAAKAPTIAAVESARSLLDKVERHEFGRDPAQGHVLKRADFAIRLLAWLVARPDRALEPPMTPQGDAETLGRWYAEEGGFVDWARRAARGTTDTVFGRGIEAVVGCADKARTELDRRFARGLAGWVTAGQPATSVVPIHDAVRRVARKFLEGNPDRRLLVLLMDGMAWSQAVEILGSMSDRRWGPLAWHATVDGKIGQGVYPVMFAGFPTVTEVSRSSFFAGAGFKPGERLNTAKDPARWEANAHAKVFAEGADVPRLLLRAEARTGSGGASPEALSLVASPERRMVAVVLNAIDDQLKASEEVNIDWTVDRIKSLPDLLDKARACGRTVLLTSDHGHVPSDRLVRKAGATSGGGARWRPWPGPEAPVADNEVAVTGGSVYIPKGAHGVVMLTDDASSYAGNTHSGEHGGATLAEVVAPCLLVGSDDHAQDPTLQDQALRIRPAHVPGWWNLELREPAAVKADVPPPRKASGGRPKPVDDSQLGLPVVTPPPKPAKSPPASKTVVSTFATSEVLAAQVPSASKRKHVVEAVDLLLAHQGVMSAATFASALGQLPFRASSLVSVFSERLNVDGYRVLWIDPQAKQVHLDREKLSQLFEVQL